MEAASGAAGRANAGLCSASSLCLVTRHRTSLGCRSIDVGATRTVDVRRAPCGSLSSVASWH